MRLLTLILYTVKKLVEIEESTTELAKFSHKLLQPNYASFHAKDNLESIVKEINKCGKLRPIEIEVRHVSRHNLLPDRLCWNMEPFQELRERRCITCTLRTMSYPKGRSIRYLSQQSSIENFAELGQATIGNKTGVTHPASMKMKSIIEAL